MFKILSNLIYQFIYLARQVVFDKPREGLATPVIARACGNQYAVISMCSAQLKSLIRNDLDICSYKIIDYIGDFSSLAMLKFFPKFVFKCSVCSDSDLGMMLVEISLGRNRLLSWQLKININGDK